MDSAREYSGTSSPGEEYYDLGSYTRTVTTERENAQKWFDRGLNWHYAFNHEEAVKCYEKSIDCDPNLAMAHWGMAQSLGPNYNRPWSQFEGEDLEMTIARAHRATEKARLEAKSIRSVERKLIDALCYKFPQGTPGDSAAWNRDYASAMEEVLVHFREDLDVLAFYAESLMNLTPWALWDLTTGLPRPGARTYEIKTVLENALCLPGGLSHPGLIHLYIHLMEMSPTPEAALPIANHLRGLVPDAGHLHHMPTHLDILCGDYQRAINSNSIAIIADEKYLARNGSLNLYSLYRVHNYHFRIYAAMFSGQSKIALDTITSVEASIPEELLRLKSPPMADILEGFLSSRVHVLIRFGLWKEIIDLKLPKDRELYCMTTAMIHYAKGIAFSATEKLPEADEERDLFHAAASLVPSTRMVFNNTCIDILKIASAMLEGELEYRRDNFDAAFVQLRSAIRLDDELPYDEPWGWMQPTRHAYGALLLEQGRVWEAAQLYSADLGVDSSLPRALRHPNNVWALHGYHECLIKLKRTDEAIALQPLLKNAVDIADIPIKSSCFCRVGESKPVQKFLPEDLSLTQLNSQDELTPLKKSNVMEESRTTQGLKIAEGSKEVGESNIVEGLKEFGESNIVEKSKLLEGSKVNEESKYTEESNIIKDLKLNDPSNII